MGLTRNRSLLVLVACVTSAAALGAGCSASTETVSSTGTTAVDVADGGTTVPEAEAVGGSTGTGSTYEISQSQVATAGGIPETTSVGTPPSVGAPSPTWNTTTSISDPNQPAPPPTELPTIPATGQDPVLIDCGTLYRASGWPTTFLTSSEPLTCLQVAFASGRPARLVDREQTDGEGGAILVTTYDVLGAGRLRVTVDAREAADRPKGVTVSECTGLAVANLAITPSGCSVVSP